MVAVAAQRAIDAVARIASDATFPGCVELSHVPTTQFATLRAAGWAKTQRRRFAWQYEQAGNVFVNSRAPDGGDGMLNRPCNTIADAFRKIQAWPRTMTVRFAAGDYPLRPRP